MKRKHLKFLIKSSPLFGLWNKIFWSRKLLTFCGIMNQTSSEKSKERNLAIWLHRSGSMNFFKQTKRIVFILMGILGLYGLLLLWIALSGPNGGIFTNPPKFVVMPFFLFYLLFSQLQGLFRAPGYQDVMRGDCYFLACDITAGIVALIGWLAGMYVLALLIDKVLRRFKTK